MAVTKIKIVGIQKKKGHVYFIDTEGDISTIGQDGSKKVAAAGITRERGYYYFVDNDGDISRARMAGGGAMKKGKT